ncbi:riboflavin synthase [Macrococcus brunensis]|uniref:Riboflavin synthase n=1 Tax=Macrococcus brunensis TaxID=198483 RepID=A0A4R6BFP0_9STAP|nr:riboflavin synthase [Macrococcus brunensis]TDL98642.1 riboflavin synthase [Macrococcus brunensis]ULG71376.1 riboflavin synthase [Macrococcus brunensis]ULG73683.1 riboflavin synthase [Macrococcus brunensis]
MFTGLIEEVGTIERIKQQGALKMTIRCKKILEDIKVGDSIAVDGTCLTVTSFTPQSFDVDVIIGTSDRTKFKAVSAGYQVNLERALLPTTRLGGHFVSGHVDNTGKVLRKLSKGNAIVYHISLDKNDQKYVIPKGSIAVDGTSLTIFELNANYFEIQLIPETQEATKLMSLKPGDTVHLEFDMLGKYIVRQEALACSAQ